MFSLAFLYNGCMIKFWRVTDPWGQFSNFYPSKIWIEGKEYRSVEHYFQSQKFTGERLQDYIRNQPTPRKAADEGRRRDLPLRKDWETIKEKVMYEALEAKFRQNAALRTLLIESEGTIIEDSPVDSYWGVGKDGRGKNRLGHLLMQLRKVLQNEETLA